MDITRYVLFAIGGWSLWNAYHLYRNYRKASQLGVKLVLVPVTPDNQLWIAFQTAFGSILRYLPINAFSFTRHARLGWEFHDRYRTHQRLGDAWMLVTPARNWLYVADGQAVGDIFARGKDFINPAWMLESLTVFGPNISTAEGQDWKRQRKLTATPFNEQKSILVWSEALKQANQMLKSWIDAGPEGLTTTADDTRTLALHVLAFVAFQRSYPFKSFSKTMATDAKSMTYRDSLAIILENVLLILVLPRKAFSLPFLPTKWREVGLAIESFYDYMYDQMKTEQQLMQQGQPGSGSLISNLVRAAADEKATDSRGFKPLTEAEILGNIFVFNFAGHDTTAISLAFGMLLLVANPEVQDWIHEEIRHNFGNGEVTPESYYENFGRLRRCMAVLLETLRLYNPLPGTPRYSGQSSTHLDVNGSRLLVPADTLVIPSLQAMHTAPRYWGDDSLEWRPQRWVTSETGKPPTLDSETLIQPPKGAFFAWAEGARNCPGRKFAQVEFVAVVAILFRAQVAEPVPLAGESMDAARRRTLNVVKDSNVELLLQMRDPSSAKVRWKERQN